MTDHEQCTLDIIFQIECTRLSLQRGHLVVVPQNYKSEDSDAVYRRFEVTLLLLISYAKGHHILTGKAMELKIKIFIHLDLDDEIHFLNAQDSKSALFLWLGKSGLKPKNKSVFRNL